ncbi:uncharacterized protein LOC134442692 [Engraulis encrasicolus]|uniref:uncharacterized protein LOC134442692 n=1 Tax=Engraulis encrasicolus TaxID=184585 RepID=UPI002FD19F08
MANSAKYSVSLSTAQSMEEMPGDMPCEPALIYEEHREPMVNVQVLILSDHNMALSKTTQSLTTAAEMRETTTMLMQPNANWEEYLYPAPLSIAIMGELAVISSDVKNDFSINKNPPPNGFQYIKYPDSFRACLMQICNSGWQAFNKAHKNMDQIRIHTGNVSDFMKEAVEILFNAPDNVMDKLLPNQLENISDIADECVILAEGVEKKYLDVICLIQELLEACINAQHFYGEELENIKTTMKEAQLREKMAKEFNDRSKKAMEAMGQQVEEAQNAYKQAMELIPTGWEMIGMDFLEGLANSVNSIINGCTKSMSNVGIKGMLHRVSFAEEMDITSDMKILSSSGAILEIMGSLIQNVNEDEIDWRNLYDQKSKSMKSKWTKTQFQNLKDDFEMCPDNKAKKSVLSLLRKGIAVCDDLATYKPDQEWDSKKTKKLIKDLQSLQKQALAFDSKSKKLMGSPALAPKSPMLSKALTNSLGDTSVSQQASENARFRIEQSREQLKHTREQYNKCVENMEKNRKELTEILCELQNCEIKEIDFETTIKMLVKGMDAMGRVKEQWEKMVLFFQMVSNIVKTSLHRTLTKFVTAESTKARMYNIKLFTKDMLYNQMFQASNIANLVHIISGTYTEISGKYLMDRVSSPGRLMAMDSSNPQLMREREMLQESCKEAQDGILQLVLKNKKEFEEKTDARMAKIEGSLKAILPAAAPETTERLKEIVQAGFAGKEQPQTVL